jgi:predicted esterase
MATVKRQTRQYAALVFLLMALGATPAACSTGPSPADHRFAQPWPFYLYLPDSYTPDRGWPLFIGVNGSSADGRSCWNTWQKYADEKGYVLLCPELADPDGRLEQLRGNARLLQILDRVYAEYSLQPKIFLAGFSAGGQFVHGYAFMNPSYVVGVSVIATGNFYQPPQPPGYIPFVVIVGDHDDPGNVANAKSLASLLAQAGYPVELHILESEGHTVSNEAVRLTLALYDRTAGDN